MTATYTSIAARLREDILSGRVKPGELLPPVEDLMRRFGAGEFSVRHAISVLSRDGALRVTKHVGARVLGGHLATRKGRVVFITVGRKNNFHDATFAERIAENIRHSGYEFADVVIESVEEERRDLSALRREISYGIDLALVNCVSDRVTAMLERHLVPFALTRSSASLQSGNAVASFSCDESKESFIGEMISLMRRRKVRTVLEIDYKREYEHRLTRAMHDAGFTVTRLWGENRNWGSCAAREVEQMGMELVSRYFADTRHRDTPPDLVLFMDDYLARGGLLALSAAGLSSPEDVKIATQSNKNYAPVYFRKLTRFESNPEYNAQVVSRWTVSWLSGRPNRKTLLQPARLVAGETL